MVDLPRHFVKIQRHLNKMHKPFRQNITPVSRNKDQVYMQHVNDMLSSSIFHLALIWTNRQIHNMKQRGYQYKLHPSDEQATLFVQFAGVCRLVYNVALEQRRDYWRQFKACTGNSINYPAQAGELTMLREEYDWIRAVHVTPQQQALRDLDRAYANFFNGIAKYPGFRRLGVNDSFRFQGREIKTRTLNAKWSEVRLPKIGWVQYRDTRPLAGTLNNVTINLTPSGWHISFNLAIEHDAPATPLPTQVGIDRSVAETLALSTGEMLTLPSSLAVLDRKKRKAQRVLARRKRGSVRYAKQ